MIWASSTMLHSPPGGSSIMNCSNGQFGLNSKKYSPRLGSLSPKKLKGSSKKLGEIDHRLLSEFDEAQTKKDELLYEGMGLLTLYQRKVNSVRMPQDFVPKYFQTSIGSLSKYNFMYLNNHDFVARKDMEHIKKRTGKNIKHLLFDKLVTEEDLLRLEPRDLAALL